MWTVGWLVVCSLFGASLKGAGFSARDKWAWILLALFMASPVLYAKSIGA
jgi:hypothetical protein